MGPKARKKGKESAVHAAQKAPKVQKKVRKVRKVRKPGTGTHFTAREKALLCRIYDRIVERRAAGTKRPWGNRAADEFTALTDVHHSVVFKARAKKQKAGGSHPEPKQRGCPPLRVEQLYAGFYDWLSVKVERARTGGFLTLKGIHAALRTEVGVRVSLRVLRRSMRRLGFRYKRRRGVWQSKRESPRVQRLLQAFLERVEKHTEVKDNKLRWKVPVGFQDESYTYEYIFRASSWCAEDDTYDRGKHGDGRRINILHTLVAATGADDSPATGKWMEHPRAPREDGGLDDLFVHWMSTWTGKKREYKGNVNGDTIRHYFISRVGPRLGAGGFLMLDNASTHKEWIEKVEKMKRQELERFIQDKESEAGLDKYAKATDEAAGGGKLSLAKLRSWIRKRKLRPRWLVDLAGEYGVTVWFVPPYHPQCNPIEAWWAYFKHLYADTDPSLKWQERVEAALEAMPDNYAETCITRSLEWCAAKLAEMRAGTQPAAPPDVGDSDAEDSGASSDSDCDTEDTDTDSDDD